MTVKNFLQRGFANLQAARSENEPVNEEASSSTRRHRTPTSSSEDDTDSESDEPPAKRRALTKEEMMKNKRVYAADLNENETECGICYESFKGSRIIRRLKCSHPYHQLCIFAWLKKDSTCPLCRYNLVDN